MEPKNRRCLVWALDALRYISLGQYQTKLHFRGRDTHSSVLGGLFTIVCIVVLAIYGLVSLIALVRRENFNLKLQSRPIVALEYNSTSNVVSDKRLPCPGHNCEDIDGAEVLRALFESHFFVYMQIWYPGA